MDDLKSRILDTADTNNWTDNGGNIGTIHTFAGWLVVCQTRGNRAMLERLLSQMRDGVRHPYSTGH
jgi:hypothetical protein